MKRRLHYCSGLLLCTLILFQMTGPALALEAQKDETVYVNLNCDGSVQDTIVVNSFLVPQSGVVCDYGNYTKITNLSGDETPVVQNNLITWRATPGSTFYYRGEMEKAQLPWNFSVGYTLNGSTIDAPSLVGADGHLIITVEATANGAADSYFGNNYAAQITISLKEQNCKNVASDASVITAAGKKTSAFTVLPGTSGTYTVSADVTDFEMDGISIQMVNMAGGLLGSLDLLQSAVSQITNGISALSDGSGQLKGGAQDLSSGLNLVSSGTQSLCATGSVISAQTGDLAGGAQDLQNGLDQLSQASAQIREGLLQLNENSYEFEKGYGQIDAGLKTMLDSRKAIESGISELKDNQSKIKSGVKQLSSGATQLQSGIQGLSGTYDAQMELVDQLVAMVEQQYAANPEAMPVELQQLIGGISQYESGINTGFDGLASGAGQLGDGIHDAGDGMQDLYDAALEFGNGSLELMDGISQLHDGMTELNTGFEQYEQGVSDLSDSYLVFDDSLTQAQSGAAALAYGVGELDLGLGSYFSSLGELSDSLGQLAFGAAQLPDGLDQLESGADQLLTGIAGAGSLAGNLTQVDGDAVPVSFAAPGLVTPNSVQFIVKTPDLHAPEKETAVEPAQTQTFLQKLWSLITNLFT